MKNSNTKKSTSSAKSKKSGTQSVAQMLPKIGGANRSTLMTAGAAVLGAAAVGVLGYFVWKKRDSIIGFAEQVGDKITSRFSSQEQTESDYPYTGTTSRTSEDYYTDSSRHM